MKLPHPKFYSNRYVVLIIFILFLIPLVSYGQNKEALTYLKQELVRQQEEYLQKIKELQMRIDSIDLQLEQKKSRRNTATYLVKSTQSPISPNKTTALRSTTIKRKTTSRSGRVYHRGPRGGCYYINSNGNKTYVARSLCK